MKQHLGQSLTLDELAGVANMSASHYSALFRQKVQSAPINFFTYLKMQKACQLLKYSHLRIKEVAYQVGYSDPYHFSRVFTGVMGIPPRDFRRKETT
jgi:AraC-like DNA-binding protein